MNAHSFYARIWLPVFMVTQVVALIIALIVDPGGFDSCEATASSATRAVQVAAACIATIGSGALAVWRLRGAWLILALLPIAFASLVWLWLLSPAGSC